MPSHRCRTARRAARRSRRSRRAAGSSWSTCRPARGRGASGFTRTIASSMTDGGKTCPHSVSIVCTSAIARSAISASRCPKRPKTGTSTRSPGRTSDTIAASMPARDVPSIEQGRVVPGRPDAAVELLRLGHRRRHERVVLADERRRHRPQHARIRRDRARSHQQARGRVDRARDAVGHCGSGRSSTTVAARRRARRTRAMSVPARETRQTPDGRGSEDARAR